MRKTLPLAFSAVMVFTGTALGTANTLERLVMPGEVIQGHAKYESECTRCHEPFKKTSQTRLCLDCHKDVASDMEQKLGYHGRSREVAEHECKHCHTDHKGRNAIVVLLDKEVFDHTLTDFPIREGHLRVACDACHAPKTKYREAPPKCIGCHKERSPHRGNLGENCIDCHSERNWKETRFDHGKTKLPLRGKHEKVACSSCHPNERYDKKTPSECRACHLVNDVHKSRFGGKCKQCHTPEDWKRTSFNHDKTRYPLQDKHKEVKCDACHKRPGKPGRKCSDCHEKDDVHKGRYGKECEPCHTAKDWKKSIFDHAKTKYPLEGKHREAACDTCHVTKLTENKPDKICFTCHQHDDEHKGRYGEKCGVCHTLGRWKPSVFDHDKTEFPLREKHREAVCEACHRAPSYERKLGAACIGCHQQDERHDGRYGEKCDLCHMVKDWKTSVFDHEKTRFPLRKKHRDVKCDACHKGPIYEEKLATACYTCHRKHDVHKGQEGERCGLCHNEGGWTVVFFDHDQTRLPLLGQHALVPCEECHLTAAYKDSPLACGECHAAHDVHKQGLGTRCDPCHNPNGWAFWRFEHNSQSKFVLDGAHEKLTCQACHREPAPTEIRLPKTCVGCHREDDVHSRRFGQTCKRCHRTNSFQELRTLH